MLVYRGTLDWADWGTNFESTKVYWGGPGTVHYGFVSRFHALWDPHPDCGDKDGIAAVLAARHRIDPRTGKAPGGQLYVTGHSMGGALANLTLAHTQAEVCGDDVGCATAPRVDMSALYTFGSPKVGNETFAYATAARARGRTPIYRFVNGDDVVTGIPRDLDPIESVISDYRHVGYAGEGEDIFQVWLGDRTMSISSFVLHLLVNKDDHLKYLPPLEFQAKARNEMH